MIDILKDEISLKEKFGIDNVELIKGIDLVDVDKENLIHYYRAYEQNNDEISIFTEFVLEDITQEIMEEIQDICEKLYFKYNKKVNVYWLEVDCRWRMRNQWKKETEAKFEVNSCWC